MHDRIWWVSVTGQAEGPYGRDAIAAQHAQGRVDAATPVWREGMTAWLPAAQTDLAPLVAPQPAAGPPPPAPMAPPAASPPPPGPSAPPSHVATSPQPSAPWQQPTPDWHAGPGGAGHAPTGWSPHAPPSWQHQGQAASASNGLSTAAIVCGAISLLFFPILFGPAGIICAGVAKRRNEPRGDVAMGIAIGGMVLGFIIGAVVGISTAGL